MIWVVAALGLLVIIGIAVLSISRVSVELESTIAPALLEVADAVEAIAEALPFEVSAVVSHDDVHTVVGWVLEFFDELGMTSVYGEELGGAWVEGERAVADEIGAVDHAVARSIDTGARIDAVHVTVIVDEFIAYMRDIGAIGNEVE